MIDDIEANKDHHPSMPHVSACSLPAGVAGLLLAAGVPLPPAERGPRLSLVLVQRKGAWFCILRGVNQHCLLPAVAIAL